MGGHEMTPILQTFLHLLNRKRTNGLIPDDFKICLKEVGCIKTKT